MYKDILAIIITLVFLGCAKNISKSTSEYPVVIIVGDPITQEFQDIIVNRTNSFCKKIGSEVRKVTIDYDAEKQHTRVNYTCLRRNDGKVI